MHNEHAFRYIECDVPEGVTLGRWRADRVAAEPRRRLVRLPSWTAGRRLSATRRHDND